IERYEINSTIEMVPNPYWFGGKPGLRRVTYRIIPSENTLLVALKTHEIDFYFAAPEQQYRELLSFPATTVSAQPSSQFEMVVFNAGRPPMADLRVRRAVSSAIDWGALARTVYLSV